MEYKLNRKKHMKKLVAKGKQNKSGFDKRLLYYER